MPNLYSSLLLPQNYIAEEILIGSIIINTRLLIVVLQNLNVEYLIIESHQIIYRQLISLHRKSDNNPVKLTLSLKRTQSLQEIGGITKITQLIKQGEIFNASNNINFYIQQIIKIIQNNYKRRLIIQYGYDIIQLAYNHNFSNHFVYIKAVQYLNHLNSAISIENLDNLQELIAIFIENINNNTISHEKTLYSGFKDLDILTHGLPQGDLIVIAGRPSIGKTSFVMNIAYHLLKYFHTQICIFSLEMTKTQILHKIISIASGISVYNLISKHINNNQWFHIQNICKELLSYKLYINDNPNITINEIANITKSISKYKIHTKAIIIDYLQLIHEKQVNIENRNQELTYITRELKILAQSLKLPVLILSQLNRSIDKRINKQPLLSDLKESGCINIQVLTRHIKNNPLHIKSIIHNIDIINIIYINNISNNYLRYEQSNHICQIYILYNYNFKFIINTLIRTLVTDNHSYLKTNTWITQNQLQKTQTIIKLGYKEQNLIEKNYIMQILFHDYSIVYDISKYKFCNFICNSIVLHNSIEQDADIVMMLYKNIQVDSDNHNTSNQQLIDIIISKNRNGPVGTINLYFNPENTIFSSKPTNSIKTKIY